MGQSSRDHHDHLPHDHHGRVTPPADPLRRAVEAAAADTGNAFIEVYEEVAGIEVSPDGPLAGVPIAVKDLIDHRDRITTAGSGFYRHRATKTAPALARLEEAGAVVIGRTNLHEFAFGFSSENPWFGPVRNPWDHDLSAGGSSGGSAAAVAAGIVPIALGTDTGGSVRVPAAICGVTGLKVTHGLIPLDGVFPLVPSLDTVGAIAADLDDLTVTTRVMAGPAWQDSPSPDAASLRLIVPDHWVDTAPLDSEVEAAFRQFVEEAAAAGLTVEHRELPLVGPSSHQAAVIGAEVAPIHQAWREAGEPYGDDVGARVDAAIEAAGDAAAVEEGRQWRATITSQLRSATADGTVVVTPTVASMDKHLGDDRIGDHHYRTVLSWFCAPVNPTGCPALTIPMVGPGRRPGLQLIGDRGADQHLLDVARLLQDLGLSGMMRWSSE